MRIDKPERRSETPLWEQVMYVVVMMVVAAIVVLSLVSLETPTDWNPTAIKKTG